MFIKGCPICRFPLRNTEITGCKAMDSFVKLYSEKITEISLSKNYKDRVKEYELWKKLIKF